ncbi:MAG TPA: hypothetical protein VIN58_01095, partial [Roseateles sp.]
MSAGNARRRALLIQRLAASHTGAARGICARELARQLGVRERVLRQLISDAREDGVAIAGMPETGYY